MTHFVTQYGLGVVAGLVFLEAPGAKAVGAASYSFVALHRLRRRLERA